MTTPRHIYAVRHCEREDDVNKVWYYNSIFGRDNPPLSDRGHVQAAELKEEFKHIHIDFCFSSPYERCIQTAAKILERPNACSINVEPGFLESGHLIRESGQKQAKYEKARELATRYPGISLAYQPFYLAPQEDEFEQQTVRACFLRVKHTVQQVLKRCNGDILIVTHQAPLAAIQEFLLGPTKELLFPAQATVSKYVERPASFGNGKETAFTDDYLCDSSHLSDFSGLRGKHFPRKRKGRR